MNIRKAKIDEAGYLSDLSFRSKAYWGYSDDFMEACREVLTVSPDDISSSLVFVIEDGGTIKGFIGWNLRMTSVWLVISLLILMELAKGTEERYGSICLRL